MKIKKLERKLNKLIKEEYGADGYLRVDRVEIDREFGTENLITIKGAYGREGDNADGKVDFQLDYELSYPDGKSAEFVAGMLYQYILTKEYEDNELESDYED